MDKFAWLSRLITFDTTSRNSNLELINCIKKWLHQHAIPFRLTYNEDKQKANLFATVKAQTNETEGGIILSGHTDCVPVDNQKWQMNPFVATRVQDKIYGRGACDMKGFLAVMLSLVPFFKKLQLSKPIHLAFSYDEEVGCDGARTLIRDFKNAKIEPSACIVGEPSNMQVVVAHKGIQAFRCRVMGKAAHSSLTPQGCNAIEHAAAAISRIREFAYQLKTAGPFDDYFDVPFSTMTTNIIHGGTAGNIIPDACEFVFEFRQLPQVEPKSILEKIKLYLHDELLPMMRKEYSNAAIEIEALGMVPSFATHENTHIYQLAQKILADKAIHKVAYATEAGLFQAAGIPTIICGPGSIGEAHRPDEFVSVEQLEKCEMLLRRLVS